VDILAVQESLYATAVNVPGYFWLAPQRPEQFGTAIASRCSLRGIGFLISNKYRSLVKVCKKRAGHEFIESFWIKLCGKGDYLDTYVCSVYAPGPQHGAAHCQKFFAALADECVLYQGKGDVLLLGDFNARLGNISGDSDRNANGARFLEMLRVAFSDNPAGTYTSLLNCSPDCFGLPTRVEGGHRSVIDYIICPALSRSRVSKVHVETHEQKKRANGCGSDHNLLWVDWKLWNVSDDVTEIQSHCYRLCWKKDALSDPAIAARYNYFLTPALSSWQTAFASLISKQDFLLTLSIRERQILIDGAYASWNFIVHDALCRSVPVKSVGQRSRDWWDPDLQVLIDRRTAAHASLTNYCRNLPSANEGELLSSDPVWQELWSTYAELRQQAHNLIQSNKAKKWQHLISKLESEFESDKCFFFATIQRIRSAQTGKKASSIPSLLVPPNSSVPNPGSLTSDPQEIKQILFEFQSGLCKASSDYEGFDPMFFADTLQTVSGYPSSEVGPGFCERAPTITEVNTAVDTLCNYKAAGLDLLFNECLKAGNLAMRESLTSLFTGLWKLECSPSIWARATIHLIPKGHDADVLLPSSYRPISLTSSVSKVFEKIILKRLDCYADEAELFPEEQAGFRKGRSPIEQAYILREVLDYRKSLKKQCTFLCFVDLQSAFSSTWR
jgi:hypothetical protein